MNTSLTVVEVAGERSRQLLEGPSYRIDERQHQVAIDVIEHHGDICRPR
jgi:hypothetical protein